MANEESNKPSAAADREKGLFKRKPWLAMLLRVLVVLLLIAAAVFWWQSRKYEDTDDAEVDGHIDPISARVSGHVVKVNVEEGQFVKAGTVLVEIDDRDYQVAVDRARADYMDAVASAEAAPSRRSDLPGGFQQPDSLRAGRRAQCRSRRHRRHAPGRRGPGPSRRGRGQRQDRQPRPGALRNPGRQKRDLAAAV